LTGNKRHIQHIAIRIATESILIADFPTLFIFQTTHFPPWIIFLGPLMLIIASFNYKKTEKLVQEIEATKDEKFKYYLAKLARKKMLIANIFAGLGVIIIILSIIIL
jgi:hypothetical protein